MKQFFAPISKINKKTREVHGILALEVKDKEGEIMDYEASKPYFEKWIKGIQKVSRGKSMGNLRVMHQPIIGGKFTQVDFDDNLKGFPVVAKVSNDKAWQQVLDGELNGFSIYGNPVWKKRDKKNKAIRYAVEPLEGSLVDNPCMYGADFTLVKEDGQEIVAKFVGNKEPEQFWHCKKDCDLLHKTQEEATNCLGIVEKNFEEINDDDLEKDFSNVPKPVVKSMYDVSSLASNISSLKYIDVGNEENLKRYQKAIKTLFSVLTGMVKVEKDKFESTLNELSISANAVKVAGLTILKGEDMKIKVKKSKSNDENTELDDDELEFDTTELVKELEPKLAKRIAKSVGAAVGEVIKETIEEALEEVSDNIQLLNKAVMKMAALPKKSNVVVKKSKDHVDDTDDEDNKKISKRKKKEDDSTEEDDRTSDRTKLVNVMKAAMRKPVLLNQVDENEDENEDDKNEDNEE